MEVFRLCTAAFAALDGEGARLYGGRWNSPGRALIYASQHLSLAVLEYLVHVELDNLPNNLIWLHIHIPDSVSTESYPENSTPPEATASKFGDAWVKDNRSLLLVVPSAVLPIEFNVLINPKHREMKQVKVIGKKAYSFDPRLLRF
jgi:RES domain-containing protein